MRGKPAGCFYVDHRHVSGLFGVDEERLAQFIATIAGAALENAEGFAELRLLNETLEQRVAERTATAEARAGELVVSNAELERIAAELRRSEDELPSMGAAGAWKEWRNKAITPYGPARLLGGVAGASTGAERIPLRLTLRKIE